MGGSDPFVTWILAVADEEYPPTSNSISWGTTEQKYSASSMDTFNTEARNLGLRGVTITVSSGDNGVTDDATSCDDNSGSSICKWKVQKVSMYLLLILLLTYDKHKLLCEDLINMDRERIFPILPSY